MLCGDDKTLLHLEAGGNVGFVHGVYLRSHPLVWDIAISQVWAGADDMEVDIDCHLQTSERSSH